MLIGLTKLLSERILTEIRDQTRTSQQNNIVIAKCWNIIQTIGEQKIYKQCFADMEQVLLPLLEWMKTPEKISFDADILLLMNSFIKISEEVTDIEWILVQTFPQVFKKNDYMFNNLFTTINLLIINGKKRLIDSPQTVEMVSAYESA